MLITHPSCNLLKEGMIFLGPQFPIPQRPIVEKETFQLPSPVVVFASASMSLYEILEM
jgi:hypothetical protein